MKRISLILITTLCCASSLAQHKGFVYQDNNRNGEFDKGDKPFSNVVVSDGLNVTKTDSEGKFTLEGHQKEKFVFITIPSGYKTYNDYYQAIDKNADSYNFAVMPYTVDISKDGAHDFVQISDTEIRSSEEHDQWVQELRDYTQQHNPAFIVQTGDICYPEGLKSHIEILNTRNMGLPVYYIIGNHDLVSGDYGEQLFESLYGPVFYSFDVGNMHYIVTPMLYGDYKASYTKEDVYRWLKEDLKYVSKDKSIIVFNHDLLTHDDEFIYGISDTEKINLDDYDLKAWIYGHWHINHIHQHKNAVSISTSTLIRGGIDHASSGFRILSIDADNNLTSELRYTYFNKSLEIASHDNLHTPILSDGAIPVSVNTYSTSYETTSVEAQCSSNGAQITKPITLKQNSNFNFSGKISIPEQYKNELVTLTVTAKYENGEVAKRNHSFIYNDCVAPEVDLGENWTNLLGNPEHIGVIRDTMQPKLQLKWTNNVESNFYMSSPLIADGSIYTATLDEDFIGRAYIVSMDAKSGEINWKTSVESSIRNTITTAQGKLFAQDVRGNLYALDCKSGEILWTKELKWGAAPALNVGLVSDETTLYAGTGAALCAIDIASGKTLWEDGQWGAGEGCTVTLSLEGGVLIGGAHWGAIYANDAKTGKRLWGNSSDALRHRSSSPAMKDGLLYVVSSTSIIVMRSLTGEIILSRDLGYSVNVTSTPLVTESEIIFGTAQKGLIALDKATLEQKWQFECSPALIYSVPYITKPSGSIETSPIQWGETIYFAASDGTFYGVDKATGTLQWKHQTGAPCF
ncbi:MAG: PQQ-binding-like beta-propeller repeat protein, partial [Rikenellaceae bacterium]